LGSFYTVCVHRYLSGESIVFPGSKCPACGHKLRWWENVPVASFLLLQGRCRGCKTRISWRYPTMEAVSGLWALALALKFPLGPETLGPFFLYLAIGGVLIVASFIDFDSYLLPDVLTLPGAALGFLGAWLVLGMPLRDSLIGAGVGAGSFWALQVAFKKIKGYDGLGTGDIKLMLLLGALLGWRALTITAGALTALLASVYYMRKQPEEGMRAMVPFGPFLSLGGMLYILFGDYYWAWLQP